MPARIVDGDAVYMSDRVKSLKPEFRAEYSYLVPLAEANGVFEADPNRIWVKAYAFHRDWITPGLVQDILSDMERVGLLRTWTEAGKRWGYWTGIDKPGRLPPKSHLKRYKNLPPNPPLRIRSEELVPDQSGTEQD